MVIREFKSAKELKEHYKGLFNRLNRLPLKPVVDQKLVLAPKPEIKIITANPYPIDSSKILTPEKLWLDIQQNKLPYSNENARKMIKAVALKWSMNYKSLVSSTRTKHFVLARREACWWLFKKFKFSSPVTGKFLNLDHSTVLYAVKKHEEFLKKNGVPDYAPEESKKKKDLNFIARTIKDILTDYLKKTVEVKIVDVLVNEILGDDQFVRVEVLYEGFYKGLKASNTSEVFRHIRPKLLSENISTVPVFSFIPYKEWVDEN